MQKRKDSKMQWIGIALAVVGLIYGGIKDYQNGAIKIPQFTHTENVAQKPILYPMQYCTMAYDPNTDRVWYQHEDGVWKDTPPMQKKIGTYYY